MNTMNTYTGSHRSVESRYEVGAVAVAVVATLLVALTAGFLAIESATNPHSRIWCEFNDAN